MLMKTGGAGRKWSFSWPLGDPNLGIKTIFAPDKTVASVRWEELVGWLAGGLGNAHVTRRLPSSWWAFRSKQAVWEAEMWDAGRTDRHAHAGHDPWRRPMERSREASREAAIEQLRSQRLKPKLTLICQDSTPWFVPPTSSQQLTTCWVLPPYRIIEQVCILRQTLTINFSQKNLRYLDIKIIPLESSFEYESNGIIFI
jgi:hypothetical protein